MAFGGNGGPAGGFDFFVRGGAADFFGEGHGDGFGVDEAASEIEILAHARGIDLEIGRERGKVMKRAGGEADDFGESDPFGVPGAEAALMRLRLRCEDGADETGDAICGGENGGASDGILFVGHGGGSAAAGSVRFGDFGDFGLHVKREVEGDLIERAGREGEGGSDFGDAIAMGMPGSGGERERKRFGEMFRNEKAVGAEGGESADGAAKLQSEGAIGEREKAIAVTEESVEPRGDEEAEGSGESLLKEGARDEGSGAVFFGEGGEGIAE